MALILTDEKSYEKIANSIRAKNGSTETYTPEQMSEAIDAMSVGSGGGDMFKEHYATQSDTKVDTALNAEALGGTPASGFVLSADFNALSQKVDGISASDIGAAEQVHSHAISDVEDLQSSLSGKASASHTHSASSISGGQFSGEVFAYNPTNPSEYRLRNSAILQTVKNPSNNGEITWVYE